MDLFPESCKEVSAKEYILEASFFEWYFVGTLPFVALKPEAKEGDTVRVFRKELDPNRGNDDVRIVVQS